MIQRIQTVYLLCFVAAIATFLTANCTISEGTGIQDEINSGFRITSQKIVLLPDHNTRSMNWGIILSQSACAITAFIAIFLFRDLKLQKKLLSFNYLLIAVSCLLILMTHYNFVNSLKNIPELHYSFCLLLPLSLFLFNFLSIRGIAKDIELLASSDRLR